MRRVLVRYKVKPGQAARNEELVRAVYEELHRTKPEGMRYATFRAGPTALEVRVYSFGPESGNLLPNVNRWRGQIGLGEITDAFGAAARRTGLKAVIEPQR